ncbi:MAG: FKBP-type peptidyl-prolyl cis-trans isomerase [Synechococcus sp. SB0666_bin_14]|nr:FKBP-type peptidyl-prolyl cis-trans isomerase [Synechococcus sp. SB0666_bin_14]MYG47399.1 FKBP-type peptidyl-prolyl cis-trans isomerase [Synechococcus sp. SB0675_bin_6]MYJ60399.1 FKBP-type peptidyl-prolyl cis-trans isomerase [Synechococcus sp. SB0672_bin_6]MYK91302.1 FKBP-type peptidyl-prolyl cis-trans isomerase [Synechococcus sp. SB0669_bin_8]
MQHILVSAGVCVSCLLVALVSQWLAPAPAGAQTLGADQPVAASPQAPATVPSIPRWELDPDDPNPTLFAMASGASTEAGAMDGAAMAQTADDPQAQDTPQDPPMTITPSGLKIIDLQIGTGREAVANTNVTVHYDGRLEDGKEFDSSRRRDQPFQFRLGAGQVIKGWDEGLVGMKEGGKRQLVIPPELGYGQQGAGGVIPPNATLVFDVELLKVGG